MRYLGAFALSVVVVASLSGPAKADDGDCTDFRNKILAADARGEIFLGYYKLRNELGRLYATFCPRDPPVRLTDAQYAKVCGGPVPDDPDQRADMLQLCAVQGAYPDQPSPSDLPDMTVPGRILPNGMSAASAWAGQIAKDPGYQRMCAQAATNENTCRQRQANMRTCQEDPADPTKCATGGPLGTAGQAGAFNDCAALYQGVLGMCHAVDRGAAAPPALPKPPQAVKAAPPSPPPAKANPNAPQASSAPPPKPADSGMSPKCQQLVSNYIAASQANDGPKALAGYNALKQEGGCNVLAQVDKPMPRAGAPSADDPRFATGRSTSLSDQVIGGCDASPDVCAARVQQLRAGVSPEAVAALWMHAINVGLELGTAMTNAAAMGAQRAPVGGGSNMGSIGNRPVRSTYGQGSPTQIAPRQSPSDITGTTR